MSIRVNAEILRLLGDVEGHEFHGNQYSAGSGGSSVANPSSVVSKLDKGGVHRENFQTETAAVKYLQDTQKAFTKAGWTPNDWTPGKGGSDTGHGASYQFEKGAMTADVTRHNLSIIVGSHRTEDY